VGGRLNGFWEWLDAGGTGFGGEGKEHWSKLSVERVANFPARLLLGSRCVKYCVSRGGAIGVEGTSKDMRGGWPRLAACEQDDGQEPRGNDSLRALLRDNVIFNAVTLRLGNTAEYRRRRAGKLFMRRRSLVGVGLCG